LKQAGEQSSARSRAAVETCPSWANDWHQLWVSGDEHRSIHARLGLAEVRQFRPCVHPLPTSPVFAVRSPGWLGSRLVEPWSVAGPAVGWVSMHLPTVLATAPSRNAPPLADLDLAIELGWQWAAEITRPAVEDWFATNRPSSAFRPRTSEIWWFDADGSVAKREVVDDWDHLAARIIADGTSSQAGSMQTSVDTGCAHSCDADDRFGAGPPMRHETGRVRSCDLGPGSFDSELLPPRGGAGPRQSCRDALPMFCAARRACTRGDDRAIGAHLADRSAALGIIRLPRTPGRAELWSRLHRATPSR
jgi:hypothetical protein